MHCPACSTPVPADAENRFCEECGAELNATPVALATCACGARLEDRDEDGFCMRCGKKNRVPLASDHMEEELSSHFASVSDRGLRHDHNEDRCGIAAGPAGYAMVVCDGVSSSRASELASGAVVEGTLQALTAALASITADAPAVMLEAIAAGCSRLEGRMNLETRRTSSRKMKKPEENPPSTTLVAAVVVNGVATIAWVGDSRAYWIDGSGAHALTRDHSWQNEVVAAGTMTAEEAAKSPKAHAITRWIGTDAGDAVPEIVTLDANRPGTLLLCTDGLWNYAATPEEMEKLVLAANEKGTALEAARELVGFALQSGGQDNVTVTLLQVTAGKVLKEGYEG